MMKNMDVAEQISSSQQDIKQIMDHKKKRFIISGGGTGGHIFPALSIADEIKQRWPDATILFVGADNRMEMERVPAAGYEIVGLPIAGFNRKNLLKNIPVVFKLFKSMRKARSVIKKFKPNLVVGVGGYASGPILRAASSKGIPTVIQEQNSYAGVTNKLLAKKASKICVAYEGMENFFAKDKIVLTGNPTRKDLRVTEENKNEGYNFFGLDRHKKTILLMGGSLGARTLNNSIIQSFDKIKNENVQIIWQCGRYYYADMMKLKENGEIPDNILLFDFVSRMDYAYSVADLIISRAGAGSISEFCLLSLPVILVPSPNVAEDHQTKNAKSLSDRGAAVFIADREAEEQLFNTAINLVYDQTNLDILKKNIYNLAQKNSSERIVDEIEKILENKV